MPRNQGSLFINHIFNGGWDTDSGPTARVDVGDVVEVPFLVNAENAFYERDGGPHKVPGTAKLNSSQLESGAVIKGLFDYWITGSGANATQKRVVYVNTGIYKDDADGTFDSLFTGLQDGAVVCFSQLDDILIISTDNSGDVPMSWDGSTAQNLAGSPPNFSISASHKNRSWAAGVEGAKSTLYYSVSLDPEDWASAGSGSISIDPDDGDEITAIASHRNELWIFKGPYKGSIHRITGSSPTGDDAFARTTFAQGVGAVGQNTIFRFGNDLGFMWSDGTIRSLAATDAFGDFSETSLSRPINAGFLDQRLNRSRLKHAWAAVDDVKGVAVFAIPIDSSTNNNVIIAMDFRFQPVRWSYVPGIQAGCVASVVDSAVNNRRILMLGGNDGYVRKWNQSTRSNDGSSLAYKVTMPHLDYGLPAHMKIVASGCIGLQPKNNGNVTFGWTRDNMTQQTKTVSQGGSAVLGSFELGTDTLGGARFVNRFFDLPEGGEFRSVQFEVSHNVDGEDVELHNIGALISVGGISLEN